MDAVEIPELKLNKVSGGLKKKGTPFLPKPDAAGRITLRSWVTCSLGQIVFLGIFIVGAFGYGRVQKEQYKKFQASHQKKGKTADKLAIARKGAENKSKEKIQYEGDLSSLPTVDKGGDSLSMTWGYFNGMTPAQRAKAAAEAKAKQEAEAKAEADAVAQAEAEAAQGQQAAMPQMPGMPQMAGMPAMPGMPGAPAAAASNTPGRAQVAQAPRRPMVTKRLAKAGGLSGGILRSFGTTVGGSAGGGASTMAQAPALPPGLPAPTPGAMPPGVDPAAVTAMVTGGGAAAAAEAPEMPAASPAPAAPGARAAAVTRAAKTGAGVSGLRRALAATSRAKVGGEAGSNISAQAFDNESLRKEATPAVSNTADIALAEAPSAPAPQEAAVKAQPSSRPIGTGAELKDCGNGQFLEECPNAASGPEPKDPSAPLVAALNLSSVGLAALVMAQSVLHKRS